MHRTSSSVSAASIVGLETNVGMRQIFPHGQDRTGAIGRAIYRRSIFKLDLVRSLGLKSPITKTCVQFCHVPLRHCFIRATY
jgi:hypothetical protein